MKILCVILVLCAVSSFAVVTNGPNSNGTNAGTAGPNVNGPVNPGSFGPGTTTGAPIGPNTQMGQTGLLSPTPTLNLKPQYGANVTPVPVYGTPTSPSPGAMPPPSQNNGVPNNPPLGQ